MESEIEFGFRYSQLTLLADLLFGSISYFILSGGDLAQFGLFLINPATLTCLFALEVFKIFLAKRISGHRRAFSLPQYSNPIRGDPSKGPVLRRTVLKVKKLIFKLKPYQRLALGVFYIAAAFLLTLYVTICFGAPVLADQPETCGFSALITVLAFVPAILTFGPDYESLESVFFQRRNKSEDPLGHLLFALGLGSVIGAWLGALPIPLDWDRPWQVWPVTCAFGSYCGRTLFNAYSLTKVKSSANLIRRVNNINNKKQK